MIDNHTALVPVYEKHLVNQHQNIIQRRRMFADWLNNNGMVWYKPDLLKFATYLGEQRELSPYSINNYIGSIKTAYREMLDDEIALRQLLTQELSAAETDASIRLMRLAIQRDTAKQQAKRKSEKHLYLSVPQVERILKSVDRASLKGLRDAALLSTLFGLGLRDIEVSLLMVDDLNKYRDDKKCLYVGDHPQCTERYVSYEKMEWVLPIIFQWLRAANISDGYVFRRIRKGDDVVRSNLSPRSIYSLLQEYPLIEEGKDINYTILDIRHSYARTLYKAGVDIGVIHANFGNELIGTTAKYIGKLDGPNEAYGVYRLDVNENW